MSPNSPAAPLLPASAGEFIGQTPSQLAEMLVAETLARPARDFRSHFRSALNLYPKLLPGLLEKASAEYLAHLTAEDWTDVLSSPDASLRLLALRAKGRLPGERQETSVAPTVASQEETSSSRRSR